MAATSPTDRVFAALSDRTRRDVLERIGARRRGERDPARPRAPDQPPGGRQAPREPRRSRPDRRPPQRPRGPLPRHPGADVGRDELDGDGRRRVGRPPRVAAPPPRRLSRTPDSRTSRHTKRTTRAPRRARVARCESDGQISVRHGPQSARGFVSRAESRRRRQISTALITVDAVDRAGSLGPARAELGGGGPAPSACTAACTQWAIGRSRHMLVGLRRCSRAATAAWLSHRSSAALLAVRRDWAGGVDVTSTGRLGQGRDEISVHRADLLLPSEVTRWPAFHAPQSRAHSSTSHRSCERIPSSTRSMRRRRSAS